MYTIELNDPANDKLWEDLSTMKRLTCRNHTDIQYLTKNPWARSIHLVDLGSHTRECECKFSDLVLIVT